MTNAALSGKPEAGNPHVRFCLKCVLLVSVFCASLTVTFGSTWTGNGDGVNWSDAKNWDAKPTTGSAITFPSGKSNATVVDADFAVAKLGDIKLSAGFTGSVTLARPLSIGAFEISGGSWNQAGNAQTNTGNVAFNAGTYDFRGASLVVRAGNYTTVHKSDCTLRGGHFRYERDQNHSLTFAMGSSFESVRLGGSSTTAARKDNTMGLYGTWTISGDLTLDAFAFTQTGTLTVGGDVHVREYANGGCATICFSDGRAHRILFEDLIDGYDPGCLGVKLTNGSTTTVTSENGRARFGRSSLTDVRGGVSSVVLLADDGTLDLSGLGEVTYAAYTGNTISANVFGVGEKGVLLPPKHMCFMGGEMMLQGNGLVFQDFSTHLIRAGLGLKKGTTNFVNGTLAVHGTGFTTPSYKPALLDDPAQGTLVFRSDLVCTTNRFVGYFTGNSRKWGDYVYDRFGASDGFARIVAAGSATQNAWITNGYLGASLVIDKPEGSRFVCHQSDGPLHVYRGTGKSDSAPAVAVRHGTFEMCDLVLTNCNGTSGFYQYTGSQLVATNAAIKLCGYPTQWRALDPIGELTIALSAANDHNLLFISGETTTVTRVLRHLCSRFLTPTANSCSSQHVFDLKGDLYIASNCTWGAAGMIRFSGSGTQRYENAYCPISRNFLGSIVVDKPAGALVLDSDYYAQCAYHWKGKGMIFDTDLKRGTLDLNGHQMNIGGKLSIGSDMRIISRGQGGLMATNVVTVADGATLAFESRPAGDALQPIITAVNALKLPGNEGGSVRLEILGQVTPESETTVPLFSYGTMQNFDAERFTLAAHPKVSSRYRVENKETDKLVVLRYRCKRGLSVIVR